MNLAKYNKLWFALLGAAATTLSQVYHGSAWVTLALGLLASVGVYTTTNATDAPTTNPPATPPQA